MGGAQAERRGGGKVAAVRRHHQAVLRGEIEGVGGGEIDARLRLVVAGEFGAEDGIPGKIVAPC